MLEGRFMLEEKSIIRNYAYKCQNDKEIYLAVLYKETRTSSSGSKSTFNINRSSAIYMIRDIVENLGTPFKKIFSFDTIYFGIGTYINLHQYIEFLESFIEILTDDEDIDYIRELKATLNEIIETFNC